MNSLIQITKNIINGAEINSVNLRELHSNLKSKRQFADYAKGRLGRFIENEDYICISQKSEIGNKPLIEYYVTFECAKMIAMMENNEIGDEIRRYFVSIEKQFIQQIKPLTINEQIALIAQGHQEVNIRLLNVETDLDYIKNKSPITYNQIKVLEDKRKSKTKQLVGYNPESEQSKKNYSKTISRLTKKFKDRFNISRYADLPKDNFEDALLFLNNIEMVDLI